MVEKKKRRNELIVILIGIGLLLFLVTSQETKTGNVSRQLPSLALQSNLAGLGIATPNGIMVRTNNDVISPLVVTAYAGNQKVQLSGGTIHMNGVNVPVTVVRGEMVAVLDSQTSGLATLTYTTTINGQTVTHVEQVIIDNDAPQVVMIASSSSSREFVIQDDTTGGVNFRVGYVMSNNQVVWLDQSSYKFQQYQNGFRVNIQGVDSANMYFVIVQDSLGNAEAVVLKEQSADVITGLAALTGFQTKEPGGKEPGKEPRPTGNPVCGNGKKEGSEQCDPPGAHQQCGNNKVCATNCQCQVVATCGNGKLDAGEQCERGTTNTCPALFVCQPNCQCRRSDYPDQWYPGPYSGYSYTPIQASLFCGNSKVELQLGEECDPPVAGPPPTCCPDCKKPYKLFICVKFKNQRNANFDPQQFATNLQQQLQNVLGGTAFGAGAAIRVSVVDSRGVNPAVIGPNELVAATETTGSDPDCAGKVSLVVYDDVSNGNPETYHVTMRRLDRGGITHHTNPGLNNQDPQGAPMASFISISDFEGDVAANGVTAGYLTIVHEIVHQLIGASGQSTLQTGRDFSGNTVPYDHVIIDGNIMLPSATVNLRDGDRRIGIYKIGANVEQWQKDLINLAVLNARCHGTTSGSSGGATTNGWFA